MRFAAVLTVVSALTLGACAGSSVRNFDRHSMSRLYAPENGDELVFEASVSPDYPADSAAAEDERMLWIEQWLAQRDYCPDGFEVVDRRRIGSAADNPYRHDLRYTLRCRSAP